MCTSILGCHFTGGGLGRGEAAPAPLRRSFSTPQPVVNPTGACWQHERCVASIAVGPTTLCGCACARRMESRALGTQRRVGPCMIIHAHERPQCNEKAMCYKLHRVFGAML